MLPSEPLQRPLDVPARDPFSQYWVYVLEQMQGRATNRAAVQSECGDVLED